jgi:hypothetical protein
MLVVMTLAALAVASWYERRVRHGQRRHGAVARSDRGATSLR